MQNRTFLRFLILIFLDISYFFGSLVWYTSFIKEMSHIIPFQKSAALREAFMKLNIKLNNLALRTQILFAFLLFITLPIAVIGFLSARHNASYLVSNYENSMETILSQTNLTLDTLLADATKIADLPLLSPEISRILITDYKNEDLKYARDSFALQTQLKLANRLNQNLITCIYKNKYNYTFDYNIQSRQQYLKINHDIESWIPLAEQSAKSIYFAPIQQTSVYSPRNILPMIKILYDGYDFKRIGICYVEINFKSVENIINSAQNNENAILIYNSDGSLIYSSSPLDSIYPADSSSYTRLLSNLTSFNASLPSQSGLKTSRFKIGKDAYIINGCYNSTTEWHLIQLSGRSTLSQIYKSNFTTYFNIFYICLIFGSLLAIVISRKLTRSISILCQKIDNFNMENYEPNSLEAYISNKELRKLVRSFNHLHHNLTESIQQNYEIHLAEQQMRIQMLQFQINHHFLYNTLNVIKSIASIHNIKDIETIVTCMSELIRYNLEKFPMAKLREEITQINSYMTIQSIRFPGKFIFDCNIPEQFYDYEIPAFIFQPFIENSIEHGFQKMEDNCYISITCNYIHDLLHFLIADNGQGIPPKRLSAIQDMLLHGDSAYSKEYHSIGIYNVHQRIRQVYGDSYGISIESEEGEGTIIDIVIPINYEMVVK